MKSRSALHGLLQTTQILGLLAVVVLSQQTWVTSHTADYVYESSPGRNPTPIGAIVLVACFVGLIWVGWFWANGRISTIVPSAASLAILAVCIYLGLTVPGSPGVALGINRLEITVLLAGEGAAATLLASVALSRFPATERRTAAALRHLPRPVAIAVIAGFVMFTAGSMLPWREGTRRYTGFTAFIPNEVRFLTVLGLATLITVAFALALCTAALVTRRIATGPLEISIGILATITVMQFSDLVSDLYIRPGPGLWLMAVGVSFAILTTLGGHRLSRVTVRSQAGTAPGGRSLVQVAEPLSG